MRRGATIVVSAALLANGACGNGGKLEVRAISTPLAAGKQPVPFRIAEAHGQLALGNVALALESFRKAAREDPSSFEALAGIATCYDRMGRFDLSRRNYEAALAIAPGNASLLGAFAASLDLQGSTAEAASVRREIVARLAAAAPPAPEPRPVAVADTQIEPPAPVKAAPVGRSVTVPLPPPRPAEVPPQPAPVKVATAAPQLASKPTEVPPQATPVRVATAAPQLASRPAEIPVARSAPQPAAPIERIVPAQAAPAAPPPAPAQAPLKAVRSVTVALPPPRPVEVKAMPKAIAEAPVRQGPRIERLSLGEVALITTGAPQWKATAAVAARPRFVPLRPERSAVAEVRLLNAARVDKLAARTRAYLGNRGWRKIMIGDAEIARARSLIVYPPGQREVAAKLSAQTGITMVERTGVRMVTMLLGRDAAGLRSLRSHV